MMLIISYEARPFIMLILLIFTFAHAADISGEILPPKNPADKKAFDPLSVKIHLGADYTGYLDSSNSFTIYNVPNGVYLLEVTDHRFFYKSLVVEVKGKEAEIRETGSFKAEKVRYPLRIAAEKRLGYFEIREAFSIWSILMNPMLMMTGLMLGVTFLMPKMKLDPEQMQEMKDMQKQMNNGWMSSLLNPPS